jgi:uncharacterized protein
LDSIMNVAAAVEVREVIMAVGRAVLAILIPM